MTHQPVPTEMDLEDDGTDNVPATSTAPARDTMRERAPLTGTIDSQSDGPSASQQFRKFCDAKTYKYTVIGLLVLIFLIAIFLFSYRYNHSGQNDSPAQAPCTAGVARCQNAYTREWSLYVCSPALAAVSCAFDDECSPDALHYSGRKLLACGQHASCIQDPMRVITPRFACVCDNGYEKNITAGRNCTAIPYCQRYSLDVLCGVLHDPATVCRALQPVGFACGCSGSFVGRAGQCESLASAEARLEGLNCSDAIAGNVSYVDVSMHWARMGDLRGTCATCERTRFFPVDVRVTTRAGVCLTGSNAQATATDGGILIWDADANAVSERLCPAGSVPVGGGLNMCVSL